MADVEGRPVLVAACPWFTEASMTASRIGDLLVQAIQQAIRPVLQSPVATDPKPRIALLVNLPLARPGLPNDLMGRVQDQLHREFPGTFESIALAQRGHAGALMALKSGVAALAAGKIDACVVAGADSYMDLETLEWLEDTEQLHGAGRRNNAWGFVPGEGAGVVMLMRREKTESIGLRPFGRIAGVGVDLEEKLIRTGTVCLGIGLTGAFKQVFAHLTDDLRVTDAYCDMNGEPYRADEYGFAVTRTREYFVSPSEFIAPADCWGDVGAASVPLLLILATIAFQKAYAKGDVTLVWASSDTGVRGAALVVGG
jgi:3-oxoacyl-[acyl-carrier-protein] synthase-1